MKVQEPDNEQPLAWSAILADTPVVAMDGQELGVVREVLGSQAEDIFHGLVVGSRALEHDVMIPGDRVLRITNRGVYTMVTADQARDLPIYSQEDSFKLGLVGLFRKHVGWVPDKEKGPE